MFSSFSSIKRLLEERRLALERDLETERTGLKTGQISLENNILENLQRQLEITLKVKDDPYMYINLLMQALIKQERKSSQVNL